MASSISRSDACYLCGKGFTDDDMIEGQLGRKWHVICAFLPDKEAFLRFLNMLKDAGRIRKELYDKWSKIPYAK